MDSLLLEAGQCISYRTVFPQGGKQDLAYELASDLDKGRSLRHRSRLPTPFRNGFGRGEGQAARSIVRRQETDRLRGETITLTLGPRLGPKHPGIRVVSLSMESVRADDLTHAVHATLRGTAVQGS